MESKDTGVHLVGKFFKVDFALTQKHFGKNIRRENKPMLNLQQDTNAQ